MKRKIIGLVIITMFVSGAVVYGATKNYYAELLAGQQSQIEEQVSDEYNVYWKERGEQNHRDMVTYVEIKRQQLLDESISYARTKIETDAQNRMNEHAEAVDAEYERMLAEIKEMIDNMGVDLD